MNKRAFLLAEETVKIIIAVIAISFLAYFLTSLYLSNKDAQNLEFAKSSLQHLVDEINANTKEVEIYNPTGWVIISWPFEPDIQPQSCKNLEWKDCLCICNEVHIGQKLWSTLPFTALIEEKQANKCDDKGTCLESNAKIIGDKIKIKKPFPIKLKIQNNQITQIK